MSPNIRFRCIRSNRKGQYFVLVPLIHSEGVIEHTTGSRLQAENGHDISFKGLAQVRYRLPVIVRRLLSASFDDYDIPRNVVSPGISGPPRRDGMGC